MTTRLPIWSAFLLLLSACGGSSGAGDPAGYPVVAPTRIAPGVFAYEPFAYADTSYPNGLSGQEGGFGFAAAWNDIDGDVQDRVIGGSTLGVASDMAPPSSGGRSIHWGTAGTAIYRDLDRTFGADGTTIWVSYRWISTDTETNEGLQVVDFNDATGRFGCLVGQLRGLAGDDLADGMYELGDHAGGVSEDIAARDQAIHFVLLRFAFGAADVDSVDCWWDPDSSNFSATNPDATITTTDAAFSRITLRSASADSMDELIIGDSLASVTEPVDRAMVYRVGNSLTWDSQPEGIEALAGQLGLAHDEGFHIHCGNPLVNIVASPSQVCVPPVLEYGTWDAALASQRWSAITVQPFPAANSTLASDVASIRTLIDALHGNPENEQTRIYVYAAWPDRRDLRATWTQAVADDDATPTTLARGYFTHLLGRLRALTTARVYLIPIGEVLFELDRRLRAGEVPGLSTIDALYRDDIHLSQDLGRFVAGLTTLATVHATDPTGLVKPGSWYGASAAPFTQPFYDAVYASIQAVVPGHPHTGVAAAP